MRSGSLEVAISLRNSAFDLVERILSISNSRPAPGLDEERPRSTRRNFHTEVSSWCVNRSSSWRVEEALTSMAG